MLRLSLVAALWVLLLAVPAHAASPQEDLTRTQKDMEEAKQRQVQIDAEQRKLEEELKEIQQQLVISAQAVQEGEGDLSASEDRLQVLNAQLARKNAALAESQKRLSALIDIALKLSRAPPEAMVMMPGDSHRTVKAARALSMASHSVQREIEGIKLQMGELKQLKQKVASNRSEVSRKQAGFDKLRQTLEVRLASRKTLQAKLNRESKQQAKKLEQLAGKAKDLKALVSSLDRQQRSKERKGTLRPFENARGQIQPPVVGKLIRSFGKASGRNETSKGLTVEARKDAQVVAPYDGEVVFTGPFLNYGKLVIIRHSGGFHTLLAGLAKIDAAVGEFLLEGEPIGAMGERSPANRLYVELRKDNQPIDPAPWIKASTQHH